MWCRTSAKDKKVAPALIHDFVQVLWQCQIPVSPPLFLSLCLRSRIDRLSLFFFFSHSMNMFRVIPRLNMFSILNRAMGKAGGEKKQNKTSKDSYTAVNKNERKRYSEKPGADGVFQMPCFVTLTSRRQLRRLTLAR